MVMQTGSGKTYTMLGDIEDLELKPNPHRGMTPRFFFLFFLGNTNFIKREKKKKTPSRCIEHTPRREEI